MQQIEPGHLVAPSVFPAQTLYRVAKQGHCPARIVNFLRGQAISRFKPVAALGILRIQENKFPIATPFETTCPAHFVQDEILERSEQERSKPALERLDLLQGPMFQ
jgi:hypothetical protein